MKTLFLLLALVSSSWALRVNSQWESDCTDNQAYTRVGVPGTTVAVRGLGVGYAIYAQGGTADYYVKHTTKTYGGSFGVGVTVSSVTSATISITSGAVVSYEFKSVTTNPAIIIDALGPSTSAHVYIDYCETRQ